MSSVSPAIKKRDLFDILINDKEIFDAIDGHDVEYPDELLGKYIFPFLKVNYTIQDVGTYIGLKIDYNNKNPNPVLKNTTITFLIISNNQHILTNDGDTRTDIIGNRINELFVWNNKKGFPLRLSEDVENPFDENFYFRRIVLKTLDEDNIKYGKKNK